LLYDSVKFTNLDCKSCFHLSLHCKTQHNELGRIVQTFVSQRFP